MRKLAFAGALLSLALAVQGCGGGHSSPTEPGGSANRGNWIGTISGKHAGLHLDGSCTLEMNLDATYSGRWWVDCPNASSQGQVTTLGVGGIFVMVLITTSPASNCPWSGVVTATPSTLDGQFETDDCNGGAQSSGTLALRHR